MSGKSESTFCSLLWRHLVAYKENQVLPCCGFQGPSTTVLPGESLSEVISSGEYFSELRRRSASDEPIGGCMKCYQLEKSSGSSMRLKSNLEIPCKAQDKPEIQSIEFNLGNLCNLRCRSCSSDFSSKWISDEIKLGWKKENEARLYNNSLSLLDGLWRNLKHVKVLGGEPFLNPQHEVFLQKLAAEGNLEEVSLLYATNGTVRVSPLVLDLWSRLKKIEIGFSIDGLREKNDFFRQGSRWQEILKNIQWFMDHVQAKEVEFNFHTVVNMYNVHDIPAIDDWLMSEFPNAWMTKDCLISPDWLNIRHLPEHEKHTLRDRFLRLANDPHSPRKRKKAYLYIAHFIETQPSGDLNRFLDVDSQLNAL